MTRPYSNRLLFSLNIQEDNLGRTLARECIKAKLSAAHVAVALEVTRMTIHSWYRGGAISRKKNIKMINAFLKLIKEDTEKKILPVRTFKDSQAYIEDMIGKKIK
jgi:hypothetical protein